jgi:hypothetical protein
MAIQIDHVVIAGSDLAQLCRAFESVGLTPDEGGVHASGQTHNALIGFADGSYLELIAPIPGNLAPEHAWSKFMGANTGVCAWAIRTNDIQADIALYRSRGIIVGDPTPGGRTRLDGVCLKWMTAKLGSGPLGSTLPFLIQDLTPREQRVPRTKSAESWIKGVADMLIEGDMFKLMEKAFAIRPDRYKAYPTQTGTYYLDLPINLTIFADSDKKGVRGVVLDILEFAAARKHCPPDTKVAEWRDQLCVWPSLNQIVVGFAGPKTRLASKIGILNSFSNNCL